MISPLETKAVFLDLDDTLVYTIKPIWALHRHIAAEHYGINLTDEQLRAYWGKPLVELVKLLYQTDDELLAFERIKQLKQLPEYKKTFIDPTHRAIDQIKAAQKLGVITAHHTELLDIELAYLDMKRGYFDYFQTSEQTDYHKPDPRVFDPAIEWLLRQRIQPHEAVYIGDGLHDRDAATGAGLQFIGVETGLVTAEEFRAAGAFSVGSIMEIPRLLNC